MINIIAEPSGQAYLSLLSLAKQHCTSFSLVWQDQLKFNDSAHEFEIAVKPFLIRENRTSEWPGTKLIGRQATVRYYQLADSSLTLLARVQSLYAWCSPNLPEDLAFYTKDNECWLLSISHEKDSAIIDESISASELHSAIPALVFEPRDQ